MSYRHPPRFILRHREGWEHYWAILLPHSEEYMVFWMQTQISGDFFRNHSSKRCAALLPITVSLAFPLSSLELQLSRQRNVFLQARMNNFSPITEPCVGYEQFSKHKRKKGICYPYINKLKQANLQMERIKVSVWVTSKLIPSRNAHHLPPTTHTLCVPPVPPRAKSQAERMHLAPSD